MLLLNKIIFKMLFVLQDGKITDAANESRDNVKYLYTLDKFFSSMTKASPVSFLKYY